ncbi:TadE/TadG family type IV pilus assembly protein [Tateyamaria sp. SN6-1]|uniref:TadE/TadG family type IV pilus assembly protein n=1 Tax=Tateyamaria sp. SN6-1 TaxID=3092148 RepID=UPI0039F4D653
MTQRLRTYLRRFRREEDGAFYMIEWVIMLPLLFFIMLSAWELGLYAFRQNFLDRGLDMAVRDIRLSTGTSFSHAQVKSMICDDAGFLADCDSKLTLEMKSVDPRNFNGFVNNTYCRDTSAPLLPSHEFVHGNDHDLMVMRACYVYDPVFPHIGLGKRMEDHEMEGYPMVSVSVFVQEPQS